MLNGCPNQPRVPLITERVLENIICLGELWTLQLETHCINSYFAIFFKIILGISFFIALLFI